MNILLFNSHDLGRHLGCYGINSVHTPNIDRFAAEGLLFDRYFTVAPQCSPSRAAMFTGRYPHANGVLGLTHDPFGWDLHPRERHLAEHLRAGGYNTIGIGVLHEAQYHTAPRFFDTIGASPTYKVHDVVNCALAEMAKAAKDGRPFYLQAGVAEPHRFQKRGEEGQGFLGDHLVPDSSKGVHVPPYLVDDESARKEVAELQGAIRHLDAEFGRLLAGLDALGLRDSTLVIFTTDHGIAMPRAKATLYDPGLEICLLMRGPGILTGQRCPALLSNVDLAPTLADLAGQPPLPNQQGRSFAALLRAEPHEPRTHVFGELTYHDYYDPMRSVRDQRHKLILFFSSAPAFMDCTQSWRPRAITKTPSDPWNQYHPVIELYDLEQDPHEQTNVAEVTAYSAVKETLLAALKTHLQATEDPILRGAVTPPHHAAALRMLGRT